MMAYKVGLKPSWFVVTSYNNKPKTLAVAMQKAYDEIEVEDMLEEKFRD